MKLLDKIKKILTKICAFLLMIPTKVSAREIEVLYGPPPTPAVYGVYRPSPVIIIWKIARTFVVPIALLIGIIIYFKKSKSSKKKKILVTLGIVVLVALLYFVINKIVINLNLL